MCEEDDQRGVGGRHQECRAPPSSRTVPVTLKSLRAGFSTPPLGLQAPPRLYECWTLSDRLRCKLHDTKSIDPPFLHDTIQTGDPHSQLCAFNIHISRRKANPTMGRPSWPDHAARRYPFLSQHCTIHRDSRSWYPREPFSHLRFSRSRSSPKSD